MVLSFYQNFNALVLFIPLILMFEVPILEGYAAKFSSPSFWGTMLLSGILGFLISVATNAQINVTSPLSHNISGTAKACVQTVLALYIWKNPFNWKAILGVVLVIGGSLVYAFIRHREAAANAASPRYAAVSQNETGSGSDKNGSGVGGGIGTGGSPTSAGLAVGGAGSISSVEIVQEVDAQRRTT